VLSRVNPLRLARRETPFDDPEWQFELKHDGFRAVAYIDGERARLVSRNQHRFDDFAPLASDIARTVHGTPVVLDGEIVSLGPDGRAQFYELMARRGPTYYYAFDLLWIDGEDLRDLPLAERKDRLRALVPDAESRLLYVDHIVEQGTALFERVCAMDLEGIVAKRTSGLYREGTTWLKIKNRAYSQAEGRGDVFDRRREKTSVRRGIISE